MGFRTGASVGAWLAVAGILVLFTLALTWLAVIAGLSAKTVDGASAFSYPLIFLPLFAQQPVGNEIWTALAWCLGGLVLAYFFAMAAYRRKIT